MRYISFVTGMWIGCWLSPAASAAPPITAATLSPDGRQVVLGSQNGIEVRSWPDLELAARLPTELIHVHDLAFSPDGHLLLAAGGAPAEEGAVEVLSWPDRKPIRRVRGHDDLVYRVSWSPDGRYWVTAGADGMCHVIAAETGEQLVRYAGHSRAVLAVCYLPDGKTVVSAGVDQTLQLWDSTTGRHQRTLDNHVGTVNDVAVCPTGSANASPTIVSVSEDRTVRLWQPTIGRLMRFTRLSSAPRVVAWSSDGDRLLVGGNDGRLRVLAAETMEIVSEHDGLAGRIHVLVTSDRRVLLAGASAIVSVVW